MGGSCKFWPCAASRGPAHCTLGSCYCNEGYCRYPHSTLHIQARYCVARIPGKTCHMSRFCWSGGLTQSFCESGLCMCKWGYRVEADANGDPQCMGNGDNPNDYPDPDAGSCKKDTGGTCGWFSCSSSRNADCQSSKCMCTGDKCAQGGRCVEPENLLAAGRNATRNDDMTLAEREEIQKYEDWKVMVNVAVFAAWVGVATGVLLSGAFFLRRKIRSRGDAGLEEKLMDNGVHE